jgi:lysophospholipase L1-like esterase
MMSHDSTGKHGFLLYSKLIAIYVALGVSIILAFLYFCNLLRHNANLAASSELTLKIARTAYRYSHASIQFVCGRHDLQLGYTLEPGECRYEDVEYKMRFEVNSAGLRDDEDSLANPEIVILGDSHALGLGVSHDGVFAARIEAGTGLKVLNTGASSYGTAREMMLFRRLNIDSADIIIIQYCRNDFEENKKYFELGGQLNVMSQDKYENIASIDKERHRSFVQPGIGVLTRVVEKTTEMVDSFVSEKHDEIDEVEAFRYVLEQNKDLMEGKKIIITEINGHNRYDNLFISRAKHSLYDLDIDLHFIDVSQFLTDQDYFVLDNHMTADGHRKVAKAILDVIREQ